MWVFIGFIVMAIDTKERFSDIQYVQIRGEKTSSTFLSKNPHVIDEGEKKKKSNI